MDQQRSRWWQPTRRQLLWTAGIFVVLVVLIRIGYAFPWTGFGQTEVSGDIHRAKTLWDWLKLLIVPAVLALGGYLFTRSENRATQAAAELRAKDEAVQAYLDQMAQLLLRQFDEEAAGTGRTVAAIARARTVGALASLNGSGKGIVVQFLHESGFIPRIVRDEQGNIVKEKFVDLSGANLRDADLFGLNLREVGLDGAFLERANLRKAYLPNADLGGTRLYGADLTGAILCGASLWNAQLQSRPDLSIEAANLSGANLSGANLSGANLSGANLSGANLSGAYKVNHDESKSIVTNEELKEQAASLEGATMPDGQRSTRTG